MHTSGKTAWLGESHFPIGFPTQVLVLGIKMLLCIIQEDLNCICTHADSTALPVQVVYTEMVELLMDL